MEVSLACRLARRIQWPVAAISAACALTSLANLTFQAPSDRIVIGGAVALGGMAAALWIVALLDKRFWHSTQRLNQSFGTLTGERGMWSMFKASYVRKGRWALAAAFIANFAILMTSASETPQAGYFLAFFGAFLAISTLFAMLFGNPNFPED